MLVDLEAYMINSDGKKTNDLKIGYISFVKKHSLTVEKNPPITNTSTSITDKL